MGDGSEAPGGPHPLGTGAQGRTSSGFLLSQEGKPRTFAGLLVLAPGLGAVPRQDPVLALQFLDVLAVRLGREEGPAWASGSPGHRRVPPEAKPCTRPTVLAGLASKSVLREGPGRLWGPTSAAEARSEELA